MLRRFAPRNDRVRRFSSRAQAHRVCRRQRRRSNEHASTIPKHTSAFSRRENARALSTQSPFHREGAGNAGCALHPQSRVQNKKAHEVVTTSSPEQPGIPRAMVLTGYFVISPVIGLCCHPRLANMAGPRPVGPTSPPRDLTPASRRQDHTTSPSASAPFVCALAIAHGLDPALRSRLRADAACVHRIPAQRP